MRYFEGITLSEVFEGSLRFLKGLGISDKRSSESIISEVIGCAPFDIYLFFERVIRKGEFLKIEGALKRRGRGEPLEYILSKGMFYGMELEITEDVLIPRVETELLVELVLSNIDRKRMDIFDVATGSGAIAIAIKKSFSNFSLYASDISEKALEVAWRNARTNGVEIEFLKGDLLKPFSKKADVVISNPPYVSLSDYKKLSREVLYEPKEALLAGDDGLEFFIRMERDLPKYLKRGAKVFFEIGHNQGERLLKIFSKNFWVKKRIVKDYSKMDRFFFLEFE